MAIRTGSGTGGSPRKGRREKSFRPLVPRQPKKPLRPVENTFPEKKDFRLGHYKIVEERDDYVICEGYDPNAKDPFAEITPPAFRKIEVAKPPLLQRTPWDGMTVEIGGVSYTYEYSNAEYGVRTAS